MPAQPPPQTASTAEAKAKNSSYLGVVLTRCQTAHQLLVHHRQVPAPGQGTWKGRAQVLLLQALASPAQACQLLAAPRGRGRGRLRGRAVQHQPWLAQSWG